MNNNIVKPIDDALTILIKNNNHNCYVNGWFDGYFTGTVTGVLFMIGGSLIVKGIYNLGKESGKKEIIKKAKDILDDKEDE